MKRRLTIILAMLAAVSLLSACGGSDTGAAEDAGVALDSFYAELAEEYHWSEDPQTSQEGDLLMTSVEGELLESYYPGLGDIPAKQLIAKAPMMSSVVSELVLMQCETEDDAIQAEEILQTRVDTQAEGGAWYPESMEAWSRAQVIRQGTYVAMIASAEHQEEIAEQFNAQFE